MSSLLISETPHQVIPSLAVELGLNEAIFIQQLHWRIQNNECYYHDECLWWYHSRENWKQAFPYWSEATIKRIVQSLKKQKIITVKQLSPQILKKKTDRTNWFSINHDAIDRISEKVARQKQKALNEKARKKADKPVKIKGSELPKNGKKSSEARVESPLGQNDPMHWVKTGQCLKRKNKEDLLSKSVNTARARENSADESEKKLQPSKISTSTEFLKTRHSEDSRLVQDFSADESENKNSTNRFFISDRRKMADRTWAELQVAGLYLGREQYAQLKIMEYTERFPDSSSVADCFSYVMIALKHQHSLIGS